MESIAPGAPVEETNNDLLLAAASSLIVDAVAKLSPDKRALMNQAAQTGKLRVVLDIGWPLQIHLIPMDAHCEHQQCVVTLEDDRRKWAEWLRELLRPMQVQ